jgi:hypothetical protein
MEQNKLGDYIIQLPSVLEERLVGNYNNINIHFRSRGTTGRRNENHNIKIKSTITKRSYGTNLKKILFFLPTKCSYGT